MNDLTFDCTDRSHFYPPIRHYRRRRPHIERFQSKPFSLSLWTMRGHDRINNCLPEELIIEIFRRLDSKPTRDACSLVCKRWLSLERFSRTTLRIGASFSPDIFVTLLSRRFLHVTSIHVDERLSVSLPSLSPPPVCSLIDFVINLFLLIWDRILQLICDSLMLKNSRLILPRRYKFMNFRSSVGSGFELGFEFS